MDESGLVLDDGSDYIRSWIGKHYSEVPGNCKLLVGADPLMMLGRRLGETDGREEP